MSASSLLGDKLVTKAGEESTSTVVSGKKLIAIYFSAHWCPPCRGFTPSLAQFYNKVKEQDSSALEIIFASSDNDDDSFAEYYGEQPWTALPFESHYINSLSQKYGVRGIPTLIVLKASDLSIVDKDARSTVVAALQGGDVNKALSKWGL